VTRSRLALTFADGLELDVVAGGAPPLTAAVVIAQDVHLVLGRAPAAGGPASTGTAADATAGAARSHHPRRPGSIVVAAPRPGRALVLQAVVYDFDHRPPARAVHVFEALLGAFEEARARGLRSLAVEPLGTAHAGLAPSELVRLLAQVCFTAAEMGTSVRRVHLLVRAPGEIGRYEALLRELVESRRVT
jgi:hypothetical protein